MTKTKVIIHIDIETLDTGPRSTLLEIAMLSHDAAIESSDELTEDNLRQLQVPLQPQSELIPPRTISASTLLWWTEQGHYFPELLAKCQEQENYFLDVCGRWIHDQFLELTAPYDEFEIWSRGPQFDIVNLESFLKDTGIPCPWKYTDVFDLRTLMKAARLSTKDVERPAILLKHNAGHDCLYQAKCYIEAMDALDE